MKEILATDGLTKRFGGLVAVDNVSFELRKNEMCSIIGPNGAGKTTFFNLLTKRLTPTEGRIEIQKDGEWEDITAYSPSEVALAGIQRSYQITNVFPESTVRENVRLAAQAKDQNTSMNFWRDAEDFQVYLRRATEVLREVELPEAKWETDAEHLSHGEKRKLEIAIALASDPDVLLLDEPTAGMSKGSIEPMMDLIESVGQNHAIVIVEHNMDVVMGVSDRIVVLNQGSKIADGSPSEIKNDERVQKAYLGGEDVMEGLA